jgi:hypothetical protein
MSTRAKGSIAVKPPRQAKKIVLRQVNDDSTATVYRLRNRQVGKGRKEIPWSHFVCPMPGEVIILRKTEYCNEDTTAKSFELRRHIYGHSDSRVSAPTMRVEEIGVPATRGMTAAQISKGFGWPIVQGIRHSRFIR